MKLRVLFVVYVLVALINPGFLGTDEYWTGITRYIPAQDSKLSELMKEDDVKSPSQILPFYAVAQLSLKLGIESPWIQYRVVQIFWASLSVLLLAWGLSLYIKWNLLNSKESKSLVFLFCIFAVLPFALTRAMFESLATTPFFISLVFLSEYHKRLDLSFLMGSAFFIFIAFLFRPQVGVVGVLLVLYPLFYRQWLQAALVGVWGMVLFLVAGLPDLLFRDQVHYFLRSLIAYNFKHGAEYGQHPFYQHFATLGALALIPLWFHRGGLAVLKKSFKEHQVFWLAGLIFLVTHSLFAQKFERFLIPLLPVMLILLLPWIQEFIRLGNKIRLGIFFGLQALLWIPANMQASQGNILSLARYIDAHPEISTLYRREEIPEWIPEAFIRPGREFSFRDLPGTELGPFELKCGERIVLAQYQAPPKEKNWIKEAEFGVNFIEFLAHKLNPKNNRRRVSLNLYGPSGCD